MTDEKRQEIFDWLDTAVSERNLNVFEAPRHLMSEFDLPKPEAVEIWGAWMKTHGRYDERSLSEILRDVR